VPHPLDLISLILGILFTIRQMDVTQRQAASYPGVREADFNRWWQRARGAYKLGGSVCFGKILLDIGMAYLMRRVPMPPGARIGIGLTLDLGWVALVVLAVLRSQRAHALARELGIELRVRRSGT
jgi:hypothetical protein